MPPGKLIQNTICVHVQQGDRVDGKRDEGCDHAPFHAGKALRKDDADENILKDDNQEKYGENDSKKEGHAEQPERSSEETAATSCT